MQQSKFTLSAIETAVQSIDDLADVLQLAAEINDTADVLLDDARLMQDLGNVLLSLAKKLEKNL